VTPSLAGLPLPELWFYGFALFGLLAVPAALGRFVWLFPAALAALGLYLVVAPDVLHPRDNVWIWLLLSQGTWIALVADLLFRGRIAAVLDGVPLRPLLYWSLFQLMAQGHLLAAATGRLSVAFASELAGGVFLTALGALLLWWIDKPDRLWYRLVALFWNAQALTAVLFASARILQSHPGLPVADGFAPPEGALSLFAHFSAWPGALEALFWQPLAICLHAAIFYKLLRRPPVVSSGGFAWNNPWRTP